MRFWVLAAVLLAMTSLACDCTMPIYDEERTVTADVVWSGAARYASWGPETWVADGQSGTDYDDIIWFDDASEPPALPGDLRIFPFFPAHDTPASGDAFALQLAFLLMVHDVAPGPAEIDLDDTRAALTVGFAGDTSESLVDGGVPHHGLSGHLSLTQFSAQGCQAGPFSCDLTIQGTLSFTATGANGELISVTSGTLSGTKEVYQGSQMCPDQGTDS